MGAAFNKEVIILTTLKIIDANSELEVYESAPTQWDNGNTHGQSGDRGWCYTAPL